MWQLLQSLNGNHQTWSHRESHTEVMVQAGFWAFWLQQKRLGDTSQLWCLGSERWVEKESSHGLDWELSEM